MNVTFDSSQFQATLREYAVQCPHDLQDIINKKMLFILRAAWKATPKAERSEIERALGVIGYKITRRPQKRTGKFGRSQAITHGTIAPMIINAARGRAGLKGLRGRDMAKAVSALIGNRKKAAGTMQRGWLRALLTFANASGESTGATSDGPRPRGSGGGRPAKAEWSPAGEAFYEVNIDARSSGKLVYNPHTPRDPKIDPRVEKALAEAFAAEERSMRDYIERKISEKLPK